MKSAQGRLRQVKPFGAGEPASTVAGFPKTFHDHAGVQKSRHLLFGRGARRILPDGLKVSPAELGISSQKHFWTFAGRHLLREQVNRDAHVAHTRFAHHNVWIDSEPLGKPHQANLAALG
jgi:hypothetical protein